MLITDAIKFVERYIAYKPGWVFQASENGRFEETIVLKIVYPAWASQEFPWYAPEPNITPSVTFPLYVGDCDRITLMYRIGKAIMDIEEHEMREFLRIDADGARPPFHPHNRDGILMWAKYEKSEGHYCGTDPSVLNDMRYGVS